MVHVYCKYEYGPYDFRLENVVHFPAHPSGNSCDPTRYIHCQVHNALPYFYLHPVREGAFHPDIQSL